MQIDEQLLYTIARLYYLENLSQVEISERLNLSRAKVSRLLAKAREEQIVSIQINSPASANVNELETRIKDCFNIDNVLVVSSTSEDTTTNLQNTIKHAAPYFQSFLRDGDKIGVAWGYTLLKLAENLQNASLENSSILQIAGNLDNADTNTYANEIIRHFSQKLGVKALNTLPCPVIVENSIIVDLLLHDSKISNIVNQINHIDVAFPNISVPTEESCLWHTGYLSSEKLVHLQNSSSVGSVCCRFIDKNGKIVDSSLDERTISINLDALRNARYSCACIAAENKIPPLIGCLNAGLVNVLAIDSKTAEGLLTYVGK